MTPFASTGASLLLATLPRLGLNSLVVSAAQAVDALAPLHAALAAGSGLRVVRALDGRQASELALAQARRSEAPRAALVGAGMGLALALPALAQAWREQRPLLVICGRHAPHPGAPAAGLDLPSGRLVEPITRAHFELRAAEEIVDLLSEAVRVAASAHGPVVLEMPLAVQRAAVSDHARARLEVAA
ncbi:MAG TPA: thiamine pyrophosphate-binding protein [Nevskiaceae bacterium]|nr:thiamine pyrophosphate-binding protein [Nevskiaceae bacterium]